MGYNLHTRTASFAKGKRTNHTPTFSTSRSLLRRLLFVFLSALLVLLLLRYRAITSIQIPDTKDRPLAQALNVKATVRKTPVERDVWSDTPEQHDMQIVNPLYSVRVLKSILQHSNTTWQDTKGQCQGYFVQSLLWLNIVDGMRPKNIKSHIEAVCNFPQAGRILKSAGVIHAVDTHPGDRSVGHSFPFYVDCEVPEGLSAKPHNLRSITIDIVFIGGQVEVETFGSEHLNVTIVAQKRDLPIQITPPMPQYSEFAVCLSPVWQEEEELPLWRLLEWRQHMANLGIERVNWYARNLKFKEFVEGYRQLKGSKDVFLHAPNLIAHPEVPELGSWEQYADQDAVYMSCILNNIQSSDYILILDTDEFLMPDFSIEKPLEQIKTFFRESPKWMGQYTFDRVEMVRPFEKGQPPKKELQQASYSCASHGGSVRDVTKWGPEVKTMYRSHTVHAINQHRSRQMYPMPLELSQAAGKRENEKYGWHQQHSNEVDVWPKLFHYRWYGWSGGDICEQKSPMDGMTKYAKYVAELRGTVADLVDKLSHIKLSQQ